MGNSAQKLTFDPLTLDLVPQPNDTSCGPTCLHGLYRYYGDQISLPTLMDEIPSLDTGGTLAVHLGIHALKRGYQARLYTFNLRVFDPTWFALGPKELLNKLAAREDLSADPKQRLASAAYYDFASLGGELRMADLESSLIKKYLRKGVPILTGLSSTYLYQAMREIPETCADDDLRGEPSGHFVVLTGYDSESRQAQVADPYDMNPLRNGHYYPVRLERLITAILLGVLTYDANLLIIRPKSWRGNEAEEPRNRLLVPEQPPAIPRLS